METPLIAVAVSGGRDSTALLHATVQAAREGRWRVLALHVHHGLSPHADEWLAHVESQCTRWAALGAPLEFLTERLAGRPQKGDSVEAWAREARYAALARLARARGATVVLLGHHRRDQAETFLLQALRGGGVAGLAAMPVEIERDGIAWLRPWLGRSRQDIDDYVHRHHLEHIDDDSNGDPRFVRNRLRLGVWQALLEAFPDAEAMLARAATWAQEADAALTELAALDLQSVAGSAGIDIDRWSALSEARRSLALRTWLKATPDGAAATTLTLRLLRELPGRRSGRWPASGGELRLHRGLLRFEAQGPRVAALPLESRLCIRRAGSYALPGWSGRLEVRRVASGGVPLALLAHLDLKARAGGERFQAGPGRPARSLKKQFQQAGLAAWARSGPLVYSGGLLVFVPGLGLDARVIATSGRPSMALDWIAAGDAREARSADR